MSVTELMSKTTGSGLKDVVLIAALFVALWFDPRISVIQRDIQAVHEQVTMIDRDGTRHSQDDIIKINAAIVWQDSRLTKLERQYDAIQSSQNGMQTSLSAILSRLPEKPRQ